MPDDEHNTAIPGVDSEFRETVAPDEWELDEAPDDIHDVEITSEDTNRVIRVNLEQKRVSYGDPETDDWGIKHRSVTGIVHAVNQLRTVGETLPLTELHMLGLDGHPDPPDVLPDEFE